MIVPTPTLYSGYLLIRGIPIAFWNHKKQSSFIFLLPKWVLRKQGHSQKTGKARVRTREPGYSSPHIRGGSLHEREKDRGERVTSAEGK